MAAAGAVTVAVAAVGVMVAAVASWFVAVVAATVAGTAVVMDMAVVTRLSVTGLAAYESARNEISALKTQCAPAHCVTPPTGPYAYLGSVVAPIRY